MKRNKFLLLVMSLVMICISSCQPARTARVNQSQIQLAQYILREEDLPGVGWSIKGKGWGTNYGGDSYGIIYIRDDFVFVNHIVSLYSDVTQAQQAYQQWENEWFNLANFQPKTSYTPLDSGDGYRIGCFQIRSEDPLMDCIYLQRHNQIISFVKVNFDTGSANNLTFDEVNAILGIVDKQVNEIVIDTITEIPSP